MLFTLLGTFVAGIGAAGFIVLVYKFILKRPRPKGAIPIAAGIAMILLQIILDYGWYARATADFAEDVVVLRTSQGTSLLQPLSFIIPRTDRFLALDKTSIKTNDAIPGIKLVTLFQADKETATTSKILQMIDCIKEQRADWSETMPMSQEALLEQAKWFDISSDDTLYQEVCK